MNIQKTIFLMLASILFILQTAQAGTLHATRFSLNNAPTGSEPENFVAISDTLLGMSAKVNNANQHQMVILNTTTGEFDEIVLHPDTASRPGKRHVLFPQGKLVVSANTIQGNELALIDTDNQSHQIIDLGQTVFSSEPTHLTKGQTTLFGSALIQGQGRQPFRVAFDQSFNQFTAQQFDLLAGTGSSNPRDFAAIDNTSTFIAKGKNATLDFFLLNPDQSQPKRIHDFFQPRIHMAKMITTPTQNDLNATMAEVYRFDIGSMVQFHVFHKKVFYVRNTSGGYDILTGAALPIFANMTFDKNEKLIKQLVTRTDPTTGQTALIIDTHVAFSTNPTILISVAGSQALSMGEFSSGTTFSHIYFIDNRLYFVATKNERAILYAADVTEPLSAIPLLKFNGALGDSSILGDTLYFVAPTSGQPVLFEVNGLSVSPTQILGEPPILDIKTKLHTVKQDKKACFALGGASPKGQKSPYLLCQTS